MSDSDEAIAAGAKRKMLRTRVTKLTNESEALLSSGTVDDLCVKLDCLTLVHNDLCAVDAILERCSGNDYDEQEAECVFLYKEKAVLYLSKLKRAISSRQLASALPLPPAAPPSIPTAADQPTPLPSTPSIANPSTAITRPAIITPKIEQRKFDGKYSEWLPYWESFKATVHDNDSLPDVTKFQLLAQSLLGAARDVISGLPPTSANYSIAIDLLRRRYGDTNLLQQQHLSQLSSLPFCKSSYDMPNLQKLVTIATMNVRALRSLGMTDETLGPTLFLALNRVLPKELIIQFHRSEKRETSTSEVGSNASTLSDFAQSGLGLLEFLDEKVKFQERCCLSGGQPRSATVAKKSDDRRSNLHSPRPSASLLHVSNGDKKCLLCGSQQHKTPLCNSSLTLEEKKRKLMGRCFKCTESGHMSRQCKRSIVCSKCNGRHATTLCDPSARRTSGADQRSTSLHVAGPLATTYLQTAVTWAKGTDAPFQVRLLFDSGSDNTFITEETSRKLICKPIGTEVLTMQTFGSPGKPQTYQRVEVQLWSRYGTCDQERKVITAIIVPTISYQRQPCIDPKLVPFVAKYQLADANSTNGCIDILIGCDYLWQLTTTSIERIPNSNAVAIDTKFGWTISGSLNTEKQSHSQTIRTMYVTAGSKLQDDIEKFWSLESIGILPNDATDMYGFKDNLYRETSIRRIDHRYEASLPWKENCKGLGSNYHNSENRLMSLTKRLLREPDRCKDYHNVIHGYLVDGVVEKAPTNPESSYFMPHRAVYRDDSVTTKLRIVFDASSSAPSKASLNECLYSGDNLNPSLIGVLLNFRTYKIALTSDVAKAFLQIGVNADDRNFLQFLWYAEQPSVDKELPEVVHYRFCRLPFGVTSSPYILSAVVQEHLKKWETTYPETAELITHGLYVDDLLTGAQSVSDAERVYKEAKLIFADASMTLRKWASNDENLCRKFGDVSKSSDLVEFNSSSDVLKVLGLVWNSDEDVLAFDLNSAMVFLNQATNSKRFCLQLVARVFDPLGFLAPFIVTAKLLLQELWKLKIEWDEPIPHQLLTTWNKWVHELPILANISIPRFCNVSDYLFLELHIFCDASPHAYGAAAYLCSSNANGLSCVSLVCSKSRVAPLKGKLTIPRLELMGATIATRLALFATEQFRCNIGKVHFWCDSTITLAWIKGNSQEWKPFVSNRINEIRQSTSREQWSYVASADNPADLLTRGISADRLMDSALWWNGPAWLADQSYEHPYQSTAPANLEPVLDERRTSTALTTLHVAESTPAVFEINRYSSLSRLFRVMAYVLRFVRKLRKKVDPVVPESRSLRPEELLNAENALILQEQRIHFPLTLKHLRQGTQPPKTDPLWRFQPFLDENGIMRLSGRIQFSGLDYETRHPVVLPKQSHLSELLVISTHRRLFHAGVNDVMSSLRERFFIPKLRSLTRSIVRRCTVCQRLTSRPLSAPTAPLPASRCTEAASFEVTGVDFAGPMLTKHGKKVYICLFTCAVTRAVHLELTKDLDATTFIQAFTRFVTRRGIPNIIYSDNALTFKRASKELGLLANLNYNLIQWRFNAPKAPFWGGFFERLVQSVKLSLKKVLGRATLTFDELQTVLCEVEAIVNSRPLTYVEEEEVGLLPLTPADFLIGKRFTSLPDPRRNIDELLTQDRGSFCRRWNYRKKLLDQLWKRWQREYLLRLETAHAFTSSRNNALKVGDVVLITDHQVRRQQWSLGRVQEIHVGRDGKVRSASLKCNDRILRRPVQELHLMEVE